jgi:hypothetical protein
MNEGQSELDVELEDEDKEERGSGNIVKFVRSDVFKA